MNDIKVLYVEDELSLSKIVADTLEQQGFTVQHEANGFKVIQALIKFNPDICVLDIMLPGIDGYALCKQIRQYKTHLPVIFLTAKSNTEDLVKGFDSGGTDYIRKPFSMEELIIRIRNQVMLANGKKEKNKTIEDIPLGKYQLIPARYELAGPSGIIKLSSREMDILMLLASNRNQVTERKELLNNIWGDDTFFNSRTLDVYIRKLRELLSDDPSLQLVTLKGRGYLFLDK